MNEGAVYVTMQHMAGKDVDITETPLKFSIRLHYDRSACEKSAKNEENSFNQGQ